MVAAAALGSCMTTTRTMPRLCGGRNSPPSGAEQYLTLKHRVLDALALTEASD